MQKKVEKIIEGIYTLNNDELNSVVDALKLRRNQLHYQDAQSFRVGDRVSFKGRHNVIEKGTIEKIKIKYILVRTDSGQRWNVPGSHLTSIKEKANA